MTTNLIYYPFSYYRKKKRTRTWEDITLAIKEQVEWGLSFTGNTMLSYKFQMNELIGSSGSLIVPETGDDFAICENSNRNKIVDDQLCGKAWPATPVRDGSRHPTENRSKLFWDINVMQRDFSTTQTVSIEYKTPTLLSVILSDLLLLTTGDKLGGVKADGTVINKWKLVAPDILVESFDYSGYPMGGLITLLSSIGYKFLMKYYCEPDTTYNLKVFAQVEIILSTGQTPRSALWIPGLNDTIINRATVLNPDYDPTAPYNKDEPKYLNLITDFEVIPDPSTIRNSLSILAYVQDGNNLTETDPPIVQGDKPQDTFDLGYRYRDIIFASRYIRCKVSRDSTPDATHFSLPKAEADKMVRDQSRLAANDYLACKLTHLGISYYYYFTISGQLVSLVSLAYGETAIPSAMVIGEYFELIKSISIYEDNRDAVEGSYPTYGAVKNCTLTGNGTLRFLKYDIPRPADKVYIAGYKLEEYKKYLNDITSIEDNDPLPDAIEIPYPTTKDLIPQIEQALSDQAKELKVVNFKSTLPDRPMPGDTFPVVAAYQYDEMAIVQTVKNKFISKTNSKGRPLIESMASCAPRRNNYADVINRFRPSLSLKSPTSPENIQNNLSDELQIIFSLNDIDRPENLIASGVTATQFTISWDAVTGAGRYQVEVATSPLFTSDSLLTGFHFYSQVSNSMLVNSPYLVANTPYYVRVLAIQSGTGKESAWSNTLPINTFAYALYLPINETSGTILADASGNGFNGSITGVGTLGAGSFGGEFTGASGSYIQVSSNSGYQSATKITVMAIFKPTTLGITQEIALKMGNGSGTTRSWEISLNTSNQILFDCYETGDTNCLRATCTPTVALATGNYYLIGFTLNLDDNTLEATINSSDLPYVIASGGSFKSLSVFAGIQITTTALQIAGWSVAPGVVYLRGKVSELRILTGSNILSGTQIKAIATGLGLT